MNKPFKKITMVEIRPKKILVIVVKPWQTQINYGFATLNMGTTHLL